MINPYRYEKNPYEPIAELKDKNIDNNQTEQVSEETNSNQKTNIKNEYINQTNNIERKLIKFTDIKLAQKLYFQDIAYKIG